MTSPAHAPWHKEVSALSLFIALPQLIASPIIVGIKSLAHSQNVVLELGEILDFLLISFPLTLSIAILFVILERGKLNPGYIVLVLVGAALLSNMLHWIIEKIPFIDISKAFIEPVNYYKKTEDHISTLGLLGKLFGVYWNTFGAVLFIQSCCIGIYAGYKYVKLEEKKKLNEKK